MTDLNPAGITGLLPPNATLLERALEQVASARIGSVSAPLRPLWSADVCPENLLAFLAWTLSIDQWDPAWPLPMRRARVAEAIAIQRRKGTIDAVRRVIGAFGGDMILTEWWQHSPRTTPHTFSITLSLPGGDAGAPDAAFVDAVITEITLTKPLRSHFDFVLAVNARARVGLRAVARPVIYCRLIATSPADATPPPVNALTLVGWPLTLLGETLTIGA